MNVPLTPIRFLYRAMDLYPNKVGVVCGDSRFTYGAFGERCERLAAGLKAHGIQPGDRVAYLSFNTHQLLEGYFGVPLAGAIVMPLNVRLTPAELSRHSSACRAAHADLRARFRASGRATPLLLPRHRGLDRDLGAEYEELLSGGRMARPDPFGFDENAVCELFYTSGSTGTPKGVMLSHRTLYLHAIAVASLFLHDDRSVDLHTIPLFHANGWGCPQAATMSGVKQVMVRRFDPPQVFRLIQEEKATFMTLVPTMANALLNCPEIASFDLSSMRQIMLGGAASSPELIARLEQRVPLRSAGRLWTHRNQPRGHAGARQEHR